MPIRYRRDSNPPRAVYPGATEFTDSDEAFFNAFLDWLADHDIPSAQGDEGGRMTPDPTVVVSRTPSSIEPPSDDYESMQTWEFSSPHLQSGAGAPHTETYGYTLYCGEEEPSSSLERRSSLYTRSPLPSYPPAPPDSGRRRHDGPSQKMNGCGAVIHLRAYRRNGSAVWIGKDEVTSAVVPMDAAYFECPTVVKAVSNACGCVRESVGCAICGNTLGTRYKPCQTAADDLFSLHYDSQMPICPQGPRYWHGRPSSASSRTSPSYIYTFFAPNVTYATPPPPPRILPASSLRKENFNGVDNALGIDFLDQLASVSPLSITHEDHITLEQSSLSQIYLDPDGASLPSDPGSPDETSAERMLLPER